MAVIVHRKDAAKEGEVTLQSEADRAAKSKMISELFRTCLAAIDNHSTARFVESMDRQWGREGWLSEKQFQHLKQIHDDL